MEILALLADDKIRQIKKRQFFQPQNLKMSALSYTVQLLERLSNPNLYVYVYVYG